MFVKDIREILSETLKPQDALPLPLDEFNFVFDVALNAAQLTMAVRNPREYKLTISLPDGASTRMSFPNTALNRAMVAIKQHYHRDLRTVQSAMWRFMAVLHALLDCDLQPWIRRSDDRSEPLSIHPAVVDAAATLHLDADGWLSLPELRAEVERIAREKYPEDICDK